MALTPSKPLSLLEDPSAFFCKHKRTELKGEKPNILRIVFAYLYTRTLSLFLVDSVVFCFRIAYAFADSRKVWLQTAGNEALEMFEIVKSRRRQFDS